MLVPQTFIAPQKPHIGQEPGFNSEMPIKKFKSGFEEPIINRKDQDEVDEL